MASGRAIEAEFSQFPAERVPVDSKHPSGARLIPLGAVHGGLDEPLFEFLYGFLKQNAAINHLRHQGLNLILQNRLLLMNSFRIARG